ncbi:response regulator [Deinococcus aquiradiocola]|uniref:Response regulator n=1 Tax=Deinococcus aquiradiocola TaxID=393059 RepID=A0A917UNK9_9DEIO|nr:response regulator [Deinococcus aquiradiocola]GGJ70152.1 response regulator [Deinococcus aquiradiocola]
MPDFTVLLVEDNANEAMLMEEACLMSDQPFRMQLARDGVEAIAALRDERDVPGLVLLDLNMPRMNGLEVLRVMKRDPLLRAVPVVILTNSASPEDVDRCYEAGANAYVTKPLDVLEFFADVQKLLNYWRDVAITPTP